MNAPPEFAERPVKISAARLRPVRRGGRRWVPQVGLPNLARNRRSDSIGCGANRFPNMPARRFD
jgi:hypothetical protein